MTIFAMTQDEWNRFRNNFNDAEKGKKTLEENNISLQILDDASSQHSQQILYEWVDLFLLVTVVEEKEINKEELCLELGRTNSFCKSAYPFVGYLGSRFYSVINNSRPEDLDNQKQLEKFLKQKSPIGTSDEKMKFKQYLETVEERIFTYFLEKLEKNNLIKIEQGKVSIQKQPVSTDIFSDLGDLVPLSDFDSLYNYGVSNSNSNFDFSSEWGQLPYPFIDQQQSLLSTNISGNRVPPDRNGDNTVSDLNLDFFPEQNSSHFSSNVVSNSNFNFQNANILNPSLSNQSTIQDPTESTSMEDIKPPTSHSAQQCRKANWKYHQKLQNMTSEKSTAEENQLPTGPGSIRNSNSLDHFGFFSPGGKRKMIEPNQTVLSTTSPNNPSKKQKQSPHGVI